MKQTEDFERVVRNRMETIHPILYKAGSVCLSVTLRGYMHYLSTSTLALMPEVLTSIINSHSETANNIEFLLPCYYFGKCLFIKYLNIGLDLDEPSPSLNYIWTETSGISLSVSFILWGPSSLTLEAVSTSSSSSSFKLGHCLFNGSVFDNRSERALRAIWRLLSVSWFSAPGTEIVIPVEAPMSYLCIGFVHLHFTRIRKTVLEIIETPGCSTVGNKVANEKLSAWSPLDPLLWT